MSQITRPMLAETIEDPNLLQYPVLASPKLDGIRCLKIGGKALSRSFKPIPNKHIRDWVEAHLPDGIDGELITYDENGKANDFNIVTGDVMRHGGEPNFQFHAFDMVLDSLDKPFEERLADCAEAVVNSKAVERAAMAGQAYNSRITLVTHIECEDVDALLRFEAECVEKGFEGTMTRLKLGRYKCGRSTLNEALLLKLIRVLRAEAIILECREQMSNQNEKKTNELGKSKRSTKKEGMVPAGRLGEFWVKEIDTGVEFGLGTGDGLTMELRQEIWDNQADYIGKIVTFQHRPAGRKDAPRFPVWIAFRSPDDMGAPP